MANHIIKDSQWASIAVKEIQVANGTVAIGTFVQTGAKHGLTGDTPRLGDDGNYYTTVDCEALIRIDGDTNIWLDGASVYWTGTAFTATVSTNKLIGFVDRAKPSATAGPLQVQLVMSAI